MAIAAGGDGYVTKPIDADLLLRVVRERLSSTTDGVTG
jgi:hypothetical protein